MWESIPSFVQFLTFILNRTSFKNEGNQCKIYQSLNLPSCLQPGTPWKEAMQLSLFVRPWPIFPGSCIRQIHCLILHRLLYKGKKADRSSQTQTEYCAQPSELKKQTLPNWLVYLLRSYSIQFQQYQQRCFPV